MATYSTAQRDGQEVAQKPPSHLSHRDSIFQEVTE